ncbi:MAG: hypothetical protein HZB32_06765 [Nitrospirae bacterium]|nr:hypothetical protein [Nitrospirota bacterium]
MQDIIFSPWIAWNKRNSLKNSDPWGVYLLAHFDNVPEGSADPQSVERCKKSGKDTTIRKVLIKNELKERDILTQTFIKYVERKLIWEYVKLWGKRPALNKE